VLFRKGQRKDDVMVERLRDFQLKAGVVFVGKAQEKAPVFRTEKRNSPHSGRPYPWIVKSTAIVNHYYIYAVDDDFGPFFLKFCTYFPYTAKLCLNGHEYAKRQLERQGIAYQAPKPRSRNQRGVSAPQCPGTAFRLLGNVPCAMTTTRDGASPSGRQMRACSRWWLPAASIIGIQWICSRQGPSGLATGPAAGWARAPPTNGPRS
jgi:hypothetical protein